MRWTAIGFLEGEAVWNTRQMNAIGEIRIAFTCALAMPFFFFKGIREDLHEMILECEDGVIAITKVASMLLAIKANSSVPLGLLNAKLKALADYLYTPLTVVSSKE
ncbi:unnamed protein product [Toxocara canis]|uniref:RNase H domain-containing protein n=1 Tax=Toxocara canis TaxID=6265 RepID=A0A183U972_TOXCA|nr:unnamed protein product [Toxocara canis]